MPKGAFLLRISVVSIGFCSLFILDLSQVSQVGAQGATLYQVTATKGVMVAMRDGVHLATDIYRPSRNGTPVGGKFPVLLGTPYNKEFEDPNGVLFPSDPVRRARFQANRAVSYFVARGYIVVIQDVRGHKRFHF